MTTKPHAIKKPRRKHPGTLFAESTTAVGFLERIHAMVGPKLIYLPVAQIGSGHNAWRLDGSLGRGLLAESEDGPQPGGTFRTRAVFIGNSWSEFPLRLGTIATHGWDAGVAAEQGEPIPKMSDRRRYQLRDERTAEVAARLDVAAWALWDPENMAETAELPIAMLKTLMDRYVMASPPPSPIERNDGYLQAIFSCWNCEWWGRGAALVEFLRPGVGAQLECPSCKTMLTTPTDQPDDSDGQLT